MKPPLLVLAWGNRSRGDDALGPLLADALRAICDPTRVEVIEDYQLQPEHVLDLLGRERVLFVDAARDGDRPAQISAVQAAAEPGYTTHAMSPAALLQAHHRALGQAPPPSWVLALRGVRFELGAGLTTAAQTALAQGEQQAMRWLALSPSQGRSLEADKAARADH